MKVLGQIGLSKKALSLSRQLKKQAFTVIGYDLKDAHKQQANQTGVVVTSSVQAVILHLPSPKIVWIVPPLGKPSAALIRQLADLLEPGDLLIDSSGSADAKKMERQEMLKKRGIHYFSCDLKGIEENALHPLVGEKEGFESVGAILGNIFVFKGNI